jgi:hypothetical protein
LADSSAMMYVGQPVPIGLPLMEIVGGITSLES